MIDKIRRLLNGDDEPTQAEFEDPFKAIAFHKAADKAAKASERVVYVFSLLRALERAKDLSHEGRERARTDLLPLPWCLLDEIAVVESVLTQEAANYALAMGTLREIKKKEDIKKEDK